MRWHLGRVVSLALATLIAVLGLSAPCAAHTELAESTPSPGTLVDQQPAHLRLAFTEPLSTSLVQVAVTAPDGKPAVVGRPLVSGGIVTANLGRLDVAGVYRVAYRVMAADNHLVTGEYGFRVSVRAASGTVDRSVSSPEARPGSSAGLDAASASSGISVPWVALAMAVVGLLVSAGISRSTVRRRRTTGHR